MFLWDNVLKFVFFWFEIYKLSLVIYPYFEDHCKRRNWQHFQSFNTTTSAFFHSWIKTYVNILDLNLVSICCNHFQLCTWWWFALKTSLVHVRKNKAQCLLSALKSWTQIFWTLFQSKWTRKYFIYKTLILLKSAFLRKSCIFK